MQNILYAIIRICMQIPNVPIETQRFTRRIILLVYNYFVPRIRLRGQRLANRYPALRLVQRLSKVSLLAAVVSRRLVNGCSQQREVDRRGTTNIEIQEQGSEFSGLVASSETEDGNSPWQTSYLGKTVIA